MTVTLHPKWRFKKHPHIKVTEKKIIYNAKTNRIKKLSLNGYSSGIWIDKKTFILKSKINGELELIPTEDYCPF